VRTGLTGLCACAALLADTWKLLISCVLMSRVSSTETKTRCIGGFFQAYPTPSDAIMANPSDVLPIISGLGLFETRWRAVVAITQRFLEMPEFRVGLDKEHKVYGLGEFGIDSYLIFTQYPAGCDMTPADKNLRAYCGWLKSSLAGGAVKTEPQVKVEPGIKVE
jgi:methyl-CpG-binding domain protein 4